MLNATAVPLSRRLVGRYLVFGLSCLLVCLTTTLILAFRGSLDSLASLAAIGPAVVLAVGAIVLFQSVRLNSAIESELRRISSQPDLEVQPLPGNDPVANGWNTLIERLTTQDVWDRLEGRIADAVGQVRQQQLESVFAQIPIAIGVTNSEGVIVHANQAFVGLAGCREAADVLQTPLERCLNFSTAHNIGEITPVLAREAASIEFNMQLGESLDQGVLRVTRTSLRRASDGPGCDIWTVRDITQQLLAEDMRNQFVFTATHELRTPLTNIKAYAETLAVEEGIDVEQQKQFCNIINEEATRLTRFVDELLNISQMEVGSLALHRHETDFQLLIDDVVRHVQPELAQKQIQFSAELPAKWPRMHVDKDKLNSALINLLGNAVKYTPEGGTVTLEVEIQDSTLAIHVEDTGIGINEEEQGRVFEKFFRSQDERVRALTGNGLGLAFTHEVARLHGGRLSLASEIDKGSRFTLTLPRS